MQELLVYIPLFKSLLIHIIVVPPGNIQLTVAKIPSQNLCVLATVHSVSILLHGLYVHNGLVYNSMIYSQTLKVYRNQCNNI